MLYRPLQRVRRRRRAAAAAEFALILPALMLMVLMCVDFGRFAYTYIAVHNACRAGASYGIMNSVVYGNTTARTTWENKIRDAAREEMSNQTGYDANNLAVTTTVNTNSTTGERRVRVQASYVSFRTLVAWPGIPRTLTLSKTVEMRAIR